jgi:hypothetical protein
MQHLQALAPLVTPAFETVFGVTAALLLQSEASAPAEFNKIQLKYFAVEHVYSPLATFEQRKGAIASFTSTNAHCKGTSNTKEA